MRSLTEASPVASSFERLLGLVRRLAPDDGLSLTAASTLRRLEGDGPRRLTELARLEGVSQPAMTQLVSRLERAGLARRASEPVDARVVLVQITDEGRRAMRERRAVRAERLADLMAALDPADREAILAALPALDRLCDQGPRG